MNAAYKEPASLNRFWIGLMMGLLFPAIFFILYYFFRFRSLTFDNYLQMMTISQVYIPMMSFAVLSNLIPFMFFVRSDRFKSGRGVLAITILFVVTIFMMRILQ